MAFFCNYPYKITRLYSYVKHEH